jgi:DNA-binding GntR family transcriptional regulator
MRSTKARKENELGTWGQVGFDHTPSRRGDDGGPEGEGRPSLVDIAEGAVRDWLAPGHYRRGDRLPPEHELAGMLGISRGTLRSALRRLELTGEIVRRQGSGTFVGTLAAPHFSFAGTGARISSYAARPHGASADVRVAAVKIEQAPVDSRAATLLGVAARQHVTVITRHLVDGDAPVGLQRDVPHPRIALPPDADLRAMLMEGLMMTEVLQALGLELALGRTRITPCLLGADDIAGRQLELTATVACLDIEALQFDPDEAPLLYCHDIYPPGGMEIEVLEAVDAPPPVPVALRGGARRRENGVQAARARN